ncbi:MAG: S1 RNA-binding domain-containing protein, partial [Bacteroidota bacterium]|nr:S1 RNA-binding domain-containing protein [Bacteroidota bacterium]
NAKEFFKLGDEHEAKVVTLSKEDRKMSLSIKQMSADPWSTIENQFPEGSKHKGLVKNITPYGVFVELSPGIGGMIHISDLSWLKRFNNPNEYTKTGNEIDVIIMSIDKENRKLQLGHKQIEEDPWNSLEETFPVGSIHEGTVTRRDDKGALVALPYGLEGFAPARLLFKEDGATIGAEETAQFMVVEFDRNDKKIVLSHSKIWQQAKDEEKQAENKERRAENESTKKAVKNIQSKVEKTTLGDLSALADLKKKMDDDSESTAKQEAPKAETKTEAPKAEVKTEAPEAKAEVTETPEAGTEAPAEVAEAKPAKTPRAKKVKTEETKADDQKADVAEVTAESNIVPESKGEGAKEVTEEKGE